MLNDSGGFARHTLEFYARASRILKVAEIYWATLVYE